MRRKASTGLETSEQETPNTSLPQGTARPRLVQLPQAHAGALSESLEERNEDEQRCRERRLLGKKGLHKSAVVCSLEKKRLGTQETGICML